MGNNASAFDLEYKPDGQTLKQFLLNTSFFAGIRGPIGSGKSVACCIKMWLYACAQEPGRDKVRRTRWAVIRNTAPELKTTTIKTWLEWFPEDKFGPMRWAPPYTHHIKIGLDDGTSVDMEIIFLALDTPKDLKKLLSLELTGAWVNEARELPKAIIDALCGRVSRYPRTDPKSGEPGPTWFGIIADTNSMAADHWWAIVSGDMEPPEGMPIAERSQLVKPDNWRFFKQPPAYLRTYDEFGTHIGYQPNPAAENTSHQQATYYQNNIQGKGTAYINVYVMNEYDSIQESEPVYPEFIAQLHRAKEPLEYDPRERLWLGLDFGRYPAAVFAQRIKGQWRIIDELCGVDVASVDFARTLHQRIMEKYPGATIFAVGDPTGDNRSGVDDRTHYDILDNKGIRAIPCRTNDIALRQGAVRSVLQRQVEGRPSLVVDPWQCPILSKGFDGSYGYKRTSSDLMAGSQREAVKNKYSHPHDALQYIMIEAGEGDALVTSMKNHKPRILKIGGHAKQRLAVARRQGRM